ncbi:MAG: hypothetical protein ABMB14_01890 [Myxococcota bacterium]
MIALAGLAVSGCTFPTFYPYAPRDGRIALDYVVDETKVIAVRAYPPRAPAGTPRTVEALVVAPGGTRRDVEVAFSVCGLSTADAVGVTDLRCFENDALVDALGTGNPIAWDVPSVAFDGCVPYDQVGSWNEPFPGELCQSVVPVLAVATAPDGSVASGANYVSIPVSEVPEHLYIDTDTGVYEMDVEVVTAVGSAADPTLPVTITASGPATPGTVVELEVTIEDPHYNRVAWWVDGGTLDQSGRTLIDRGPDAPGHAFNRWAIPADAPATLTVWVVLTEWQSPFGGEVPEPAAVRTSQPAWAELTLEVSR